MRNRRGISPIFATLILIAIAVIAGVAVYMFTSSSLAVMATGSAVASERVTVQAVQYESGTGRLTIYAQSETGTVTINSLLIEDSGGKVVGTVNSLNQQLTSNLSHFSEKIAWSKGYPVSTATYTATLITTNGGIFLSPSFTTQ